MYTLDDYKEKVRKAEEITDTITDDFYNDCPDPKMIKLTLGDDLAKIAKLDAKYKRMRNKVSRQHDAACKLHATVSLMAREYYLKSSAYEPEEYIEYGFKLPFRPQITPHATQLQLWLDADEIYQTVTQYKAVTKTNLDLINENIRALIERGRQLKTVQEHIRYNRGETD